MLKTLRSLNPSEKKVLVRVDFNVPRGANGEIRDMFRLRASLPTIKWLRERNNRIILLTHLGRPRGAQDATFSLKPLVTPLKELVGDRVSFAEDCNGPLAHDAVEKMRQGEILLLENVRFYPGEELNDVAFAQSLASLGEIFVNDAFAASHRAHASITGIPGYLPSCAGLRLEQEINELSKIVDNPARPLVVIMGGAKAETKLEVLGRFLDRADSVLVGGVLANVLLAAQGAPIGRSRIEAQLLSEARRIDFTSKKLHLPIDVVTATAPDGSGPVAQRPIGRVPEHEFIFDIGVKTAHLFSEIAASAGTIFWNGPMGLYENPHFSRGTKSLIASLAKIRAYKLCGGGDTIDILHDTGFFDTFNYVSSGGGAMLEFLTGKTLPGITALQV